MSGFGFFVICMASGDLRNLSIPVGGLVPAVGTGLSRRAVSGLEVKPRQTRTSLNFVPDDWRLLEARHQPPIIATQQEPNRLPTSYVGAIRRYCRSSQVLS